MDLGGVSMPVCRYVMKPMDPVILRRRDHTPLCRHPQEFARRARAHTHTHGAPADMAFSINAFVLKSGYDWGFADKLTVRRTRKQV